MTPDKSTSSTGIVDRRDWLVTGGIEIVLVAVSFAGTSTMASMLSLSLFSNLVVWYGLFVFLTIAVLLVHRRLWPIAEGEHELTEHSRMFRRWKFHQFLAFNNLFLHYQNSLLPPPIRKFFSQLLGAKIGRGLISIGGVIIDPYLITIEENAMIGHDALLLPSRLTGKSLTVRRIIVRRGAVVGARSVIEPGVTIGEGAMVKVMSLVTEGTVVGAYEVWGGVPARKMGDLPRPAAGQDSARFMGWRDLVITPAVQTALLSASAVATWIAIRIWGGGLFEAALIFYACLQLLTLVSLKIIRTLFPFRSGQFTFHDDPALCYRWSLYSFLCITHLFIHYQNGLVPLPVRKAFNGLLGTHFDSGKGLISMAGVLLDPHAVSIGEGAVVGYETLILPHAVTIDGLILKPVRLERGCVLGNRCVVMPGVVVGENSYVQAMSMVTMDTRIPANEVWGGIPARKVADLPPPAFADARIFATTWRDFILTVFPSAVILLLGVAGLIAVRQQVELDLFGSLLVYYLGTVVAALGVLKVLRAVSPIPDGTYFQSSSPGPIRLWKRNIFICLTFLSVQYQFGLVPPMFRKIFIWAMGGDVSFFGHLSIAGQVTDPQRVHLASHALLHQDSLMLPMQLSPGEMLLGGITVCNGASIGARTLLMPGVVVEENAQVQAMSWVTQNTRIPAGEVWAGVPAKKIMK